MLLKMKGSQIVWRLFMSDGLVVTIILGIVVIGLFLIE